MGDGLYDAVAKRRGKLLVGAPDPGSVHGMPSAELQQRAGFSAPMTSIQDDPRGAGEGAAAYGAQTGARTAQVRRDYLQAAGKLDPEDVRGRTALKAVTRAATPAIPRIMIEAKRPELGPKVGSFGGAARTSPQANILAGRIGRIGQGLGVISALADAVEIATAANKYRATTAVLGANGAGTLGGVGGAEAGAALGLLGGPFAEITVPAGAIIGGLAGSLLGGHAGHEAGESLYDAVARQKDARRATSGN